MGRWGWGVAVGVTGYREAFHQRKRRECCWVTLPPSASSSSATGQVAGGRPTSADFSPFPLPLSLFLYLLPALFIPHRPPHCSISWCSGALTVPALSLPRTITLFNTLPYDLIWIAKGGGCRSQPLEMGEQRSISIFYRCYLVLRFNDRRPPPSMSFRFEFFFFFLEDR